VYTALAELCGVPVPELGKRIESITFRHDGEDWTATVGQRLSRTRTERKRRQGRMRDITTRLSDSATVQAIFAGIPYMVVTDAKPLGKVSSAWVNPLFAGEHPGVTYFDPPQPSD
jgi:hypothetical protein